MELKRERKNVQKKQSTNIIFKFFRVQLAEECKELFSTDKIMQICRELNVIYFFSAGEDGVDMYSIYTNSRGSHFLRKKEVGKLLFVNIYFQRHRLFSTTLVA